MSYVARCASAAIDRLEVATSLVSELRLLVTHRTNLVGARVCMINRLRDVSVAICLRFRAQVETETTSKPLDDPARGHHADRGRDGGVASARTSKTRDWLPSTTTSRHPPRHQIPHEPGLVAAAQAAGRAPLTPTRSVR